MNIFKLLFSAAAAICLYSVSMGGGNEFCRRSFWLLEPGLTDQQQQSHVDTLVAPLPPPEAPPPAC